MVTSAMDKYEEGQDGHPCREWPDPLGRAGEARPGLHYSMYPSIFLVVTTVSGGEQFADLGRSRDLGCSRGFSVGLILFS